MNEQTRAELHVLALEIRAGFAETKASISEMRQARTEMRQGIIERLGAVLDAVADLAADYQHHRHTDEGDVA